MGYGINRASIQAEQIVRGHELSIMEVSNQTNFHEKQYLFKGMLIWQMIYYNNRCPCAQSDFIEFWMNSIFAMNET